MQLKKMDLFDKSKLTAHLSKVSLSLSHEFTVADIAYMFEVSE